LANIPFEIISYPSIAFSKLDLPDPTFPAIGINYPFLTLRLIYFKIA